MGFFDFLKGFTATLQPAAKKVEKPYIEAIQQPVIKPTIKPGHTHFQKAKKLAECLYGFPYQSPSDMPLSVRKDKELMGIISDTYLTTRAPDGTTQQTTIEPAERIRLQAEFKKRIYLLLEKCLVANPDHAPAFLLYPRIAEYNTRAGDRDTLIAMFERFLPQVNSVIEGTRAYDLIKEDIEGLGGNCFDKVERHLAHYHYDLAVLYSKEGQGDSAEIEYQKACQLCSKIYGRDKDKVKL